MVSMDVETRISIGARRSVFEGPRRARAPLPMRTRGRNSSSVGPQPCLEKNLLLVPLGLLSVLLYHIR